MVGSHERRTQQPVPRSKQSSVGVPTLMGNGVAVGKALNSEVRAASLYTLIVSTPGLVGGGGDTGDGDIGEGGEMGGNGGPMGVQPAVIHTSLSEES